MVSAETGAVRHGLDTAAVAGRQDTLPRLEVAGLAVLHPEMGHQLLLSVVAGHTVQDVRMAEIGQVLALGDFEVAGDT